MYSFGFGQVHFCESSASVSKNSSRERDERVGMLSTLEVLPTPITRPKVTSSVEFWNHPPVPDELDHQCAWECTINATSVGGQKSAVEAWR